MGNQLVGIAPSQIFPVEHYLTDHSDLLFDVNLGSTRFFKVARARSQEGLIVVKVFAIHDPTLPLSTYRDKLEDIRSKLSSAVNCLPFQRTILAEKAGFIMREYVKYSLYDRISTRPFLSTIEKKWITFQVLYALHQAHKFGVCHGDIKLENIMITSWNWVLLTDFASFKPTYLPEDNPADFSYFFDTSRRRTCYIAPERFVKTLSSELSNTMLLPEQELKTGDLHPSMDIFSAGCALTELYNEGHPPFDFSQLLAYRNSEYSASKHLDKIDDPGIRELLGSMLEKNPANRKSAEIYLSQARGNVFPEYFYSFLQSYMLIFSAAPILSPDEKINRLKKDIGNIINILKADDNNDNRKNSSEAEKTEIAKNNRANTNVESVRDDSIRSDDNTVVEFDSDLSSEKCDSQNPEMRESEKFSGSMETKDDVRTNANRSEKSTIDEEITKFCHDETTETENLDGLIIITQLVTSCIRGLHHSQSKLQSLEILLELAENTSDETILDRILPYIFHLVHDPAPRVRVSAIHTLTKCLYLVKSIPPTDVNIFPEYILPGLSHLTQDEAVIVRAAYAENIAHLAHIALRYLENAHITNLCNKEGPKPNYDTELQTLHEMVQQSVAMLLTDSQNLVKQTLMENGINKLCVFFGKQKANDVLLSHVITFLNDKEDKQLRGSFFECIVGVAAYVGWHSSPILVPLLQQGLSDPEEFVTKKAINAMATLTELGLLHKSALYQLLSETVVFLVHPNLWIRHATVGFVSASARTLNLVDVQCKVQTLIQPYLKHSLIQIEKEVLLLDALVPAVPRAVYDSVLRYTNMDELFGVLEERKVARTKAISGNVTQHNITSVSLKNLFRRLRSDSMTDTVEDHLIMMKTHLIKIHKYSLSLTASKLSASKTKIDGKLELNSMKDKIRHHIVVLYPDTKGDLGVAGYKKMDRRTSDTAATYATMNQEWRTMFAAHDNSQTTLPTAVPHLPWTRGNCRKPVSVQSAPVLLVSWRMRRSSTSAQASRPQKDWPPAHRSICQPIYRYGGEKLAEKILTYAPAGARLSGHPSKYWPQEMLLNLWDRRSRTPTAHLSVSVCSNDFIASFFEQTVVKISDMGGSSGSPIPSIHGGDIHLSPQHSLTDTNSINDHSLHERSYIQYRCAPCRLELRQLTYRKQEQHASALRAQHWADNIAWHAGTRLLPSGWRPRGVPVAHLHEHRGAVNRLVSIPDSGLFASSAADGCVRIWDACKMEGRNIANRSRQTYVHRGGPLVGLAVCEQGQSLASSTSQSGSVFVIRIEPNSSKMNVLYSRQLDLQEEGCAVDVQYLDSGSQSVLVYASLYGSLVGWDLRCPGTTWRLENDLKHGVITSFCVNNYQQWLTLGTSSGVHICWDLRFQLPISSIKHPTGSRVRKVITHPTEHSWIISAVQGNNEISMWNLETGFRQMVLWASSAPPLSHSQEGHSVCAMHSGSIDRSGFLLAGGTDMRLRFWDLNAPNESYVALPAANDVILPNSLAYEQRLIDGTNVVQEVLAGGGPIPTSGGSGVRGRGSTDETGQGQETPSSGHHDTISAVSMSNTCILTGSTDGLVQVWK